MQTKRLNQLVSSNSARFQQNFARLSRVAFITFFSSFLVYLATTVTTNDVAISRVCEIVMLVNFQLGAILIFVFNCLRRHSSSRKWFSIFAQNRAKVNLYISYAIMKGAIFFWLPFTMTSNDSVRAQHSIEFVYSICNWVVKRQFDAKYGLDNFMRKKTTFLFFSSYLITQWKPFGCASSMLLNFTILWWCWPFLDTSAHIKLLCNRCFVFIHAC